MDRRDMLLAAGALAALAARPGPAAAQGSAPAPSWPQTIRGTAGGSATLYPPQVISWPGQTTLNARMAVSITRRGGGNPVLGTMEITARTTTDVATRLVTLSDLRLTASRFPSLDTAQAAQFETRLRQAMAGITPRPVPLDTILLSLRDTAEVPSDPAVNNDPPVIFHSERPASLVIFDGDPVLAPIGAGSPLSVAVNTNWDVFFDPSGGGEGRWYLLNNGSWLAAAKPDGPYAPLAALPPALRDLPEQPATEEARKAIPGRPLDPAEAPTIFVSTRPAEIIVTDGPPRFAPVPGTRLQQVTNGNSALFRHGGDDRFYYLVSGRWFSATSLDGPWRFATPDLPADFAAIPPDSQAGSALASVPGTAQAQEAVLQAQIPRTATLDRKAATLEVTYAGTPQFKPIGDTGLSYAVNTSFEVLQVGGRYYCCQDGAWFVAPSPTGPWVLADSVPPGVHRIPPSSPLHNVTYVSVYETTPTTVTYGYLAGYLGGLVTAGVLVFGTGYWYPPVVLPARVPAFFPYPCTYAGNVWYNPTTGAWARGGAAYGPYGRVAEGGAAYNPATGAWARGGAVYGPYGGAGAWSAYNPRTGTYAHGSAAWSGGSGWANASFTNPTTGRSGSTTQNWNPYSRWGSSTVSGPNRTVDTASASGVRGEAGAFSASTGTAGARVSGPGGNQAGAVRTQGGNVYAGADGNVYRKSDDGWQKYDGGSWQPVSPPQRGSAEARGTQGGAGAAQASPPPRAAAPDPRPSPGAPPRQAGAGNAASPAAPRPAMGADGASQLDRDHQARQVGAMRQGAAGGAWGSFEPGQRFGGGGFHRR